MALLSKKAQLSMQMDTVLANQNKMIAMLTALQKGETTIMSQLDDQITALTADVAKQTTVNQSALTYIQGVPALIAAAVAQAQAAGATPAELSSLTALQTSLEENNTALASALTANTPPPAPPSGGAPA